MRTITIMSFFLLCIIMPTRIHAMKTSEIRSKKIIINTTPKNYKQLITALQKNIPISTPDFINCLADAQKKNLKIYFISQKLIDASPLNKKILTLFEESKNNPALFKKNPLSSFFQAFNIKGGFICLFDMATLSATNKNTIPSLLATESETNKDLTIMFKLFDIPLDINREKIIISAVLSQQNTLLEFLYNKVIEEKEQQEEISAMAQKNEHTETPTQEQEIQEPQEIIHTTTPLQEQEKNNALAEKYEPLIKNIQSIGQIPAESKNKAEKFIQKLKDNSMSDTERIDAQNFFTQLESRIKEIKKETETTTQTPSIPLSDIVSIITETENPSSEDDMDIYIIPLSAETKPIQKKSTQEYEEEETEIPTFNKE